MRNSTLFVALILISMSQAGAVSEDGDTIEDIIDNCFEVANQSQCDTDNDGFGNHCDADLDNNCIVNSFDLQIMRSNFGATGDNVADLDCNGVVNSFDLAAMRAAFGSAPGPSNLLTSCSACAEPVVTVPMRWVEPLRNGEVVTDSTQVTRACPAGTTMTVSTTSLLPGETYTMWFGFFQNPEECKFPPRTPHNPDPELRCGFLDLFNSATDPNMVYGDGLVAENHFVTFEAYLPAYAEPLGGVTCPENPWDDIKCSGPQIGWALEDNDTAILTRPLSTEYQAVLKSHGPLNEAEYGDKQTTTVDGGCRPADDEADPPRPADLYYPCRDPQVAGALTDVALECLDDPSCYVSPWLSVGTPFVAGAGRGADAVGGAYHLTIAGLDRDVVEGSFEFEYIDAQGEITALSGEVCALSVSPSSRANVLGRPVPVDPQNPSLIPTIALSITDHEFGDNVSFNVESITGIPIAGQCDEPPLVLLNPRSGDVEQGNFFLSD